MSHKVYSLQIAQVRWLLIISYLIAFLIDATLFISLDWHFIPSITLIMLFFWVSQLLNKVHFFTALVLGVLMDATTNNLLGSHALIFVIATFLSLRSRQSFKNYPGWQQTIFIVFYLLIAQFLTWFVLQPQLTGEQYFYYWLSPLLALVIWPVLNQLMRFFTERAIF